MVTHNQQHANSIYDDQYARERIEAELNAESTSDHTFAQGMVRVLAPSTLRADALGGVIRRDLPDMKELELDKITSKFFEKIRERSWQYGIDWNIKEGIVSLTIPNTISDFEHQAVDGQGKPVTVTGLTGLLLKILLEIRSQDLYSEMSVLDNFS